MANVLLIETTSRIHVLSNQRTCVTNVLLPDGVRAPARPVGVTGAALDVVAAHNETEDPGLWQQELQLDRLLQRVPEGASVGQGAVLTDEVVRQLALSE